MTKNIFFPYLNKKKNTLIINFFYNMCAFMVWANVAVCENFAPDFQ